MTEVEFLKRKLFLKNQAIRLLADEIEDLKNKEGTDERPITKSSSAL